MTESRDIFDLVGIVACWRDITVQEVIETGLRLQEVRRRRKLNERDGV